MVKMGLHDVYCCGQFLASVPANTATYCPDCKRWTKEPGRKQEEEKREKQCCKQVLTS